MSRTVTVVLHDHLGEYGAACMGCGKRLRELPTPKAKRADSRREAMESADGTYSLPPMKHP